MVNEHPTEITESQRRTEAFSAPSQLLFGYVKRNVPHADATYL